MKWRRKSSDTPYWLHSRLVLWRELGVWEVRGPSTAHPGLVERPTPRPSANAASARHAVLAPQQVVVVAEARVLVVQRSFHRPLRADEAADAQAQRERVFRATVLVLQVVTNRTGQVPAVVVVLRQGGLGDAESTQQGEAEDCLFHC